MVVYRTCQIIKEEQTSGVLFRPIFLFGVAFCWHKQKGISFSVINFYTSKMLTMLLYRFN